MGKRDGFTKEMREWIKARDGERCVLCGSMEKLEVHHINPFRNAVTRGHGTGTGWPISLVNSPINGITLCVIDHRSDTNSVHPDAYYALRTYHADKASFIRMSLKRDDIVREGRVYWSTTHDIFFLETAIFNTIRYVAQGNYPTPWDKKEEVS